MLLHRIILSILVVSAHVYALPHPTKPATDEQEEKLFRGLQTLSETLALLKDQSFKPIDLENLIYEGLQNAFASANCDPHSAFSPREKHDSLSRMTSGQFSGIGIMIAPKAPTDDALVVIDLVQDGPAHKSGLKVGDKIMEVNKKKLKGLTNDQVLGEIMGKTGTLVTIKVLRAKRPHEFTIKRETIKDQSSSCYWFKEHQIYYLALKMFTENSPKQLAELLQKASANNARGIILDLKNNPGGILDSAVDMAGLFIKKGSLVATTKDRHNNVKSEYKTKHDPIISKRVPIFIITNNFSASASEILAGALRYHGDEESINVPTDKPPLLVFLAGCTTYGKGSVQAVIPISNGCALKVTTMLYFLPGDYCIQARGIAPDFEFKPRKIPTKEIKWIDEMYGRETSLKGHISAQEVEDIISLGKKNPATTKTSAKKAPAPTPKDSYDDDYDGEVDDEDDIKKIDPKKLAERIQDDILSNCAVQGCVNMINLLSFAEKYCPEEVRTRATALKFLRKNFISDAPTPLEKIK